MKYLVAADSFKGSLSSLQVGYAIERGIRYADAEAEVVIAGIADGGEGTIEVLLHENKGRKIDATVHSPLMEKVEVTYCVSEIDGKDIVFIECAQSTGLHLVPCELRNP